MSLQNTNELKISILERAGEKTDGTSSYDSRALKYINNLHQDLIAGGNEFGIDTDEPWIWAQSKRPLVLTLIPAFETGTVTMTLDSRDGTYSSAPTDSHAGRFLAWIRRASFVLHHRPGYLHRDSE